MAFDPIGDFEAVVDGLEAITLTDRAAADTAIAKAQRRSVTQREADASDGHYTTSDTSWIFQTNRVVGIPQPGWTITDGDSNIWTLLEVNEEKLLGLYRCISRDLAIANRLDTLVTLQVATYAKGTGGAQEATWANQTTNLRARIQITGASEEVKLNQRRMPKLVTIFIEVQQLITNNHRFVGSDSTVYRVIGWRDPDRIDKLQEIDCEVVS